MEWVINATSRPFYTQEAPGTHCVGGLVGPGPVWTSAENLAPTGIRSSDRPASSESLYRLSYPGSLQRQQDHILYCTTPDNKIFRTNRVMWSVLRFIMNLLPTHYCHSQVPTAVTYHQSKSEKTTVFGTAGPRRDPQTPTAWLEEHECTLMTRFDA